MPLEGAVELVSDIVVAGGEGRKVAMVGIGVVITGGGLCTEVAGLVSIISFALASRRASA